MFQYTFLSLTGSSGFSTKHPDTFPEYTKNHSTHYNWARNKGLPLIFLLLTNLPSPQSVLNLVLFTIRFQLFLLSFLLNSLSLQALWLYKSLTLHSAPHVFTALMCFYRTVCHRGQYNYGCLASVSESIHILKLQTLLRWGGG